MIGIVVVSHSRALAAAAVGLASEMVAEGDRPVIAVAAGLDENTFGTDAMAVAEAIGAADSPDGVLVLLDLGSAVLSAEMALEFVDPEVAERVVLSSAPLVEGLVAAVVTASTGAPLDAVAAEAGRGLFAKQDHLGAPEPGPSAGTGIPAGAGAGVGDGARAGELAGGESVEVVVGNEHGLHARPAARLVALVNSFDATVTLTDLDTGRGPVNAGSLSMVATLNAQLSHRVLVAATGAQAADALTAIVDLAAQNFGDTIAAPTTTVRAGAEAGSPSGAEDGSPAGTGSGLDVAIGVAVVVAAEVELSGYVAGDVELEQGRSAQARDVVREQLTRLREATAEQVGKQEAAIFDAQLALLDDPVQLDDIFRTIAAGTSAPEAWRHTFDQVAKAFEDLDDAYQRERAQDVRSVRDRVLRTLTGAPSDPISPVLAGGVLDVGGTARPGGGAAGSGVGDTARPGGTAGAGLGGAAGLAGRVLVVPELDAATAAIVDAGQVVGIAVRAAGTTGHGVIVARSRGIPLITGIGDAAVPAGALVAFDARVGSFVVDPDEAAFRTTIAQREAERAEALAAADQPAITRDGQRIDVLVNVGSVQDAVAARGADGAGLVRTEVLFGDHRRPPTVDEQVERFRAIAAALGGKPITIRTWDVGGDKPLPFLPQEREANPFLGERGIRGFRRRPELLRDQLKAICQVATETPVQVMFPMVTTAEEVAWALAELEAIGTASWGVKVGIMVEVPAAALRIETLADGLDFVSIGTNDLTQYTTAADRTNTAVAPIADGLDPAVLRLIDRVVRNVPAGVEVAVCGDLASDPEAAGLLAGLGIHELSAVGPQVPIVKARLRQLTLADARTTAEQALKQPSAEAVRTLLRSSY